MFNRFRGWIASAVACLFLLPSLAFAQEADPWAEVALPSDIGTPTGLVTKITSVVGPWIAAGFMVAAILVVAFLCWKYFKKFLGR